MKFRSIIPRVAGWLCLAAQIAAPLSFFQEPSDEHEKRPLKISLMMIISAGRERFRPLMTFRVDKRPGTVYWYEVKVIIEGTQFCRVYEHPALAYTCDWDRGMKIAELTNQVRDALGAAWKRSDSAARRKPPRFEYQTEAAKHPLIEVGEIPGGVRLSVYAPETKE